jgi:putative transposase
MARLQRIEYEGAVYHVTARGNERRVLFLGEGDRERFGRVQSDSRLREEMAEIVAQLQNARG